MTRVAGPNEVNLPWLVRLRWGAVAGQIVTIAVVTLGFRLPLPVAPLLTLVALEAASNVAWSLRRTTAPVADGWLGATMVVDVLIFSGLLYFTGGPMNPFSFLYLVPIALAAVILSTAWTWALVLLSMACSAVLFAWHRPLELGVEHMAQHLRGMWVAFGVSAAFIVYFLRRIRRALAERDAELELSRSLAARQEKLAALATLAAGAAHELATPLGTIALCAKELERNALASAATGAVLDDVRLVRSQVDRCRDILARMRADAGEAMGESFVASPVGELVKRALQGLANGPRIAASTVIDPAISALRLRVPERALSEAIRGVLKNAQDASPPDQLPRVTVDRLDDFVRIVVADRGPGMAPDVLRRIGEPFFTTKPPGQGMGLGVFLARTILERLGGELRVRSAVGEGTIATIAVPIGGAEGG
ncbi:MAG TPA: ATP-binding protein [Polyangia bacterium]|nr:ATP-binding protein [Polyangia bacterium]